MNCLSITIYLFTVFLDKLTLVTTLFKVVFVDESISIPVEKFGKFDNTGTIQVFKVVLNSLLIYLLQVEEQDAIQEYQDELKEKELDIEQSKRRIEDIRCEKTAANRKVSTLH